MEKLNNRQKMAEMKARIIDEWIALNAMAYGDIPDELENHLYDIADENIEACEISFNLENKDYIVALLHSDTLINLSCFEWIADIKADMFLDFINSGYFCNVIFTVKL